MADQHTAPPPAPAGDCTCVRVAQIGGRHHGRIVSVDDPAPGRSRGCWVVWDGAIAPRWEPLTTLRDETLRHPATGHRALIAALAAHGADMDDELHQHTRADLADALTAAGATVVWNGGAPR